MSRSDPTTAEVLAALSTPVDPTLLRGPDLSRRRFLQAAGVAGTVALLPGWLAESAAAATPLTNDQGVLVLLTLAGGNDGLNTFVPLDDPAYRANRPSLGIGPADALALTPSRGLHPDLGYLRALWDHRMVAVVEGVGHQSATLSHFVSMAQHMAARPDGQPPTSGWLGRFLDGLPADPLNGVAIGSSIPLLVQGHRSRAVAVRASGGDLRALDLADPVAASDYATVRRAATVPTGLGPLADSVAAGFGEALEVANRLRPLIPDEGDEAKVVTELRLAANLINADLGIRVISIMFGDFDSHANQASMHGARMRELDAGLRAFYGTLQPRFAGRTLLVGTSEFGRRVRQNATGTDHGAAFPLFAIGSRVNPGFWGQAPSLTQLDRYGNLAPTVDFRSVYGDVAATWLGADAAGLTGTAPAGIGFLRPPAASSSGDPAAPGAPAPIASPRSRRAEVARLYLAYFLRLPDDAGYEYWVGVRAAGRSLAAISEDFAASAEFVQRYGALDNARFVDLVYRNVLGRAPDSGGLAYWTGELNRGVSRGAVLVGFSESSEFVARTADQIRLIERTGSIGRLYRAYFLREPDDGGLGYWLETGLPPAAVSEEFAASAEFRNRYGSLDHASFVAMAYRNVLGREPDAGGLAHWTGELNRGVSRGMVMLGFSDSPEFIRLVRG